MKEIWELVLEDGKPSGRLYDRASGAPIPSWLYFKVVEVFVRVGEKMLITRRHPDKWQGLKWEASGGGVLYGESDRASAVRELFEETGILADQNSLLYLGRSIHGSAMVESFLLVLDELPELKLQPSEVVGAMLVTRDELFDPSLELTRDTRRRCEIYKNELFD